MGLKDELEAWQEGFNDGQEQMLKMIKEATNLEFSSVAQLIIYIRNQESNNEVN